MAQAAVPVRGVSQTHTGWVIAGALVIVALVAGAIGYLIGGNQPAATSPNQALINDLNAAWSTTYSPARVAAVYAEGATLHDAIAGEESVGLAAIQAKVLRYISSYGFRTEAMSAPIRQGDYVVNFVRYGEGSGDWSTGISVVQLQDGKIINHWVYPAD